MKNPLSKFNLLLAFIFALSLTAVVFSQPNLITNPGFEQWSGGVSEAPDGWRFFEAGGAVGAVERMETPADVHSGSYACRIEWTNDWVGGMDCGLDKETGTDRFTLIPGHTYRLTYWLKQGRSSTDVVRATIASFDVSDAWLGDFPLSTQWVTAGEADYKRWDSQAVPVGNFTAPPDAATGNLGFRMVTTGGGTVILDDISLVDLAWTTPTLTVSPWHIYQ